jgi:hypothetical protein
METNTTTKGHSMKMKEINEIANALDNIELEVNTRPSKGFNEAGETVIRIGLSTGSAEDFTGNQTMGETFLSVEDALLLVTNLSDVIRMAIK